MKKPFLVGLGVFVFAACVLGLVIGTVSLKRAMSPASGPAAGHTPSLSGDQTAMLQEAIALMRQQGLSQDSAVATALLGQGKWRPAAPNDPYMAQAERAGDTPYAYTLADGKRILRIALAPRFFTDTTPTARAALMIHELGHVRAYQTTGRSDEYDGYKHEYDTHTQLGLTERNGLPYFAMLDGVVEYVVPRAPTYKDRSDVKAYMAQPAGG